VLATAPQGEDHILFADIDFTEVAESHARKLFLRDRRPELYAEWLSH
jgi:N-carbamoylputrescine amidase